MTKRCDDGLSGRSITDGAHVWAKRLAHKLLPPGEPLLPPGRGSPTHDQFSRSSDEIICRSTKPAPVAYAYQAVSPLAWNTNGSGSRSSSHLVRSIRGSRPCPCRRAQGEGRGSRGRRRGGRRRLSGGHRMLSPVLAERGGGPDRRAWNAPSTVRLTWSSARTLSGVAWGSGQTW